MNFSERVPSSEWTALTHQSENVAEAWFLPNGEPGTLLFRVHRSRFEVDDITQQLTLEDLLTAAKIAKEQVDSWQLDRETHAGQDGTNPELQRLLPLPPDHEDYLMVRVQLKSIPAPSQIVPSDQEVSPETWHALETRWKAILGIEASIESMRMNMESLRIEMESEFRKSLGIEEKTHALQADVAQWNKAKSRIHHAIPKAREFIHRATWASGVPERKRLDELYRTHIEPRIAFAGVELEQAKLDHLQKDRQVLLSHGTTVYQECRGITSEIQRQLSTLQRNAADRARKKRSAGREKGKHF